MTETMRLWRDHWLSLSADERARRREPLEKLVASMRFLEADYPETGTDETPLGPESAAWHAAYRAACILDRLDAWEAGLDAPVAPPVATQRRPKRRPRVGGIDAHAR